MLSLPIEAKLDIFKFFTYRQLCSVIQTNFYFYDFITNFEGKLAREELYEISILKNGLETPIPLYLYEEDSPENIVICLDEDVLSKNYLIIQLPDIIKSKDDLRIVYYYLNKLFSCSFVYCNFDIFIFNPELIELLFGNAKQICIREFYLEVTDCNIENILKFILNHLISKSLEINFSLSKEFPKYKDILFKILTKGDNFNRISLSDLLNSTTLYEKIIEYIATSRNCSKMVSSILFNFNNQTNLKLNEKAENAEIKQLDKFKSTKYQIANIFNPEVRFSFYSEEWEDFRRFQVKINIERV
ncbi:unnamed protein product [Meloidogyne enterolobii]|uniref:Uncharacterized protein n=1 Tax=Meloidogyne enterolobii TaxID=390850 RepID=A0ACB0ZXB3_MELEN